MENVCETRAFDFNEFLNFTVTLNSKPLACLVRNVTNDRQQQTGLAG